MLKSEIAGFFYCFNPRTHTGCDHISFPLSSVKYMFQSTHPHGVRPIHCIRQVCKAIKFQSTHPHGVRLISKTSFAQPSCLFQSTHPHGVRLSYFNIILLPRGFQSTHPHGVRHWFISLIINKLNVSIHAPTRGATMWFRFLSGRDKFQSTHPHGVRHYICSVR